MSRRHRANPRWNGPISRTCAPRSAIRGSGSGAMRAAGRRRGCWRPDAEQLPHEQPEIQAADLQEQALEDVAVSAQVHAAHPSGCVEMRLGTFEAFTAPTQQPITACAANPSPVGIHRVTGDVLPAPVAPAPVGLRHVAADRQRGVIFSNGVPGAGLDPQSRFPVQARPQAAR